MKGFAMNGICRRNLNGCNDLVSCPPLLEIYRHNDSFLFGYWEKDTLNTCQALENLMERLIARIREKHGRILEVACGKGTTTKHLLRHYPAHQTIGIDVSAEQTASAKSRLPGVSFLAMNPAKLAFRDASFDNMICVESAFRFQSREAFLKEAFRILKPGGRLVLSDILLARESKGRRRFQSAQDFVPDAQAYSDLIIRAGFSRAEVQETTEACFHGAFWHLVRLSHERLLAREITIEMLKNVVKPFFEIVPEMRHYVLACAIK